MVVKLWVTQDATMVTVVDMVGFISVLQNMTTPKYHGMTKVVFWDQATYLTINLMTSVMGKSQIPILLKSFKSFILKSQIPRPESKAQI